MHGDVEVGVRDMSVDVGSVGRRFSLAEGAAARLCRRAGVPVVVVISIEVDLIDVPPCVDVVSIGVEHDEDVKFVVLENADGFLVTIVPAVDVPFGRQPCERRPEVFVAMVPAINVDNFFALG